MEEETEDPEWQIENHPARIRLERYEPEFGAWVNWLQGVLTLSDAGYPLARDDLSLVEWQALAILKNHQKRERYGKDLQG